MVLSLLAKILDCTIKNRLSTSETLNQNPEQIARDRIDHMLKESGWLVQSEGYGPVVELLERIKRKKNRIHKPSSTMLQIQYVQGGIQTKQILDNLNKEYAIHSGIYLCSIRGL